MVFREYGSHDGMGLAEPECCFGMFAAGFGDEATPFRLAAQLEQERPLRDKLPPLCA
jgi:hypothetical protein